MSSLSSDTKDIEKCHINREILTILLKLLEHKELNQQLIKNLTKIIDDNIASSSYYTQPYTINNFKTSHDCTDAYEYLDKIKDYTRIIQWLKIYKEKNV